MGLTGDNIRSPNFGFLAEHDDVLVRHAALAERYVFDDSNTALIKLRQFAELLAQNAAAATGLAPLERETFEGLLERLRSSRVIDEQVGQIFHRLRISGNRAVHQHTGDRREALHQLQMARKLAVWFHRSFGNRSFAPGPFEPPPNPAEAEAELRAELERLRTQVITAQQDLAGMTLTTEQMRQRLTQAELEAQRHFEDSKAALDLAAESEAKLAEERARFQAHLAAVQIQAAAQPDVVQASVIQHARQEAEAVDIDEAATRRLIDAQLIDAGWEADTQALTYAKGARPMKGKNRAIAEWPTDNGPADYCLFVGLTPVAVVEAKRKRKDVAAAIEQAKRYSRGYRLEGDQISPGGPWDDFQVPFLFATNGRPFLRQVQEKSGVWFHDARRPTNHRRPLEGWYTPEGLQKLLEQDVDAAEARLATEPPDYLPLRDYQAAAIRNIESAIAEGRRDMLVAMATGTGKTITCIGLVYRLIKAKRFRRVLFLVDRSALGEQTTNAFRDVRLENYQTFAEIYDVKQLGELRPDPDTRLHIATVQGMMKRILYPDDNSPPVPVDWYDCVVVDECHRGYSLDQEMGEAELRFRSEADYISKYRRVLDHFDAVRIGLTATPALHTTEIFGPPIYNYTYRDAVIDGWLVDHDPPFQLVTKLAEDGMVWKKGEEVKVLDTRTNQVATYTTPDEVQIDIDEFNRRVLTESFNTVVCRALAERIDPDLPGKTLIFCVNDLHADIVVRLLKEALDERYGAVHDDTVMKITGAADKPLHLIRRFKNERLPQIVVTVDLLTTGIDVPAITNLVFIRRLRSRILFEQMLGRATRLCPNLYEPGLDKERFQIFDAVGIYAALEPLTNMKPVVNRPDISYTQLAEELRTVDDVEFRNTVREQFLAKLQRKRLSDSQEDRLRTLVGLDKKELLKQVRQSDPAALGTWLGEHPQVVEILDEVSQQGSRLVISEHEDELRRVERGYGDATKPEDFLTSFRLFILQHQDELPALVVVMQRPRELTRAQLRELRASLDQAGFSEANLQVAVRDVTNQDIAASIIGYIRHLACDQPLVAHAERVRAAMQKVLASRSWTDPQRKWLERIGKQLEKETVVDREALEAGQFKQAGGYTRLNKVFDGELDQILRDIADAMWQAA